MGVFIADLPDYKVAKGFLAQAKRVEPTTRMSADDVRRMQQQCVNMLRLSPAASYLFLYARTGITVVPARSVAHATGTFNPHELYGRNIATFFEDHFECFLGDPVFDTPTIDALRNAETRQQVLGMANDRIAERLLYLGVELDENQPSLDL
jgi:hypothetical protein